MGAALYWHRQTLSTLKDWGMITGSFVVAVLASSGLFYAELSSNVFEAQRYNWAIYCSSVVAYYILIKFTPLDWLLVGPKKAWFRPQWIGLGKTI